MSDAPFPDLPGGIEENMTMDELVERLETDPEFSAEALADRHGESALTPQLTVNWRDIDDEERPDACRALTSWVQDWLIPRYSIKARTIPDCWWAHGDLIEELSALHAAWLVAFDAQDAGWGPIGWHERFAAALSRKTFTERCAGNTHRADPVRTLAKPPEVF